jgi:hypothetical protein
VRMTSSEPSPPSIAPLGSPTAQYGTVDPRIACMEMRYFGRNHRCGGDGAGQCASLYGGNIVQARMAALG